MTESPKPETETEQEPKCTRGVKCILIHILVTLVVLLVLIVVYVGHVLVVRHRGLEAFRISRRRMVGGGGAAPAAGSDWSVVGGVFVGGRAARVLCSSVLVGARWSLAPAHCVSTRSDPDHARLLPSWRIRYKQHTYLETDIKRGIIHSFFNKDDFDNNIGLFQHLDQINISPFKFPNKGVSDLLAVPNQELEVFGWSSVDETYHNKARVLNSKKCSEFVTPIVEKPRAAEACVLLYVDEEAEDGVHGAALLLDSRIVALFSWGDRSGQTPQVMLALAPYQPWVEDMMKLEY